MREILVARRYSYQAIADLVLGVADNSYVVYSPREDKVIMRAQDLREALRVFLRLCAEMNCGHITAPEPSLLSKLAQSL